MHICSIHSILCRRVEQLHAMLRGVRPNAFVRKFGDRVRELRELRGFSQEKLGERAKLHRNAIGQIERGEIRATIETLDKLARALAVEPADFFPRSST